MTRRGAALFVLLAMAAACGGSSPLAPAVREPVTLSTGRYILRIFNAPQLKTVDGFTTSVMLCISVGRVSGSDSISVPVDVTRDGEDWVAGLATAGTLELRFRETAGALAGSLRGEAETVGLRLLVRAEDADAQGPAAVTGLRDANGIGGQVHGEVLFSSTTGGYQSCSTNAWSLVRQ